MLGPCWMWWDGAGGGAAEVDAVVNYYALRGIEGYDAPLKGIVNYRAELSGIEGYRATLRETP